MRGRVPNTIRTARYKRGFDVPQAAWVRAGLGSDIRQRLVRQRAVIDSWLPPSVSVGALFADERLASSPIAVAEATSLLWLAEGS